MQLRTVCVPWTFVLLTSAFNSAVSYAIRNENADRFKKPNLLKPEYPHAQQMVRNEEQKKLLAEFGGDKKYEVISVRIDNNPSKGNMFTMVEGAILMEEARLVSKSVRNEWSSLHGGRNGMKRSNLARSHRGPPPGRGGPGGWYGRGPYGPWGPPGGPTPWSWGPPPWAWRPPPWAYWSSPWSPPPWAWGSPWSWGGQYNQSVPNQWATISPVNPTRPTQNQGINTGLPVAATTSPTVSKPAVPIVPTQGISTISPIMRPTMTTPGIPSATNQGMTTRPVMISTTTMPPTVTKPAASSAPIQGMTTRPPMMIITTTVPPIVTRPGASTIPQGMTIRPPLTTTPGLGLSSFNGITPTAESVMSKTTPMSGTSIPPQGSITTRLPGGQQLTPGQVTTRMPFKHGPMEPDMDYQPIESSGQSPTKGPVSQSGEGLRDPAPSMDLNGQKVQTTFGPDTSIGSGDQNEQGSINEVSNRPENQNTVQTENGPDPVDPSRLTGNNDKGKHGPLDSDQLKETDVDGTQTSMEQRPTAGTNDQEQQGLRDPALHIKPDEHSPDEQSPSDQLGQNGSPGQDQMNPGQTEVIIHQSKDESHHDETGADDQGQQVPANPGPTSVSNEQIQQGSVNPSPEVIQDGQTEKAPVVQNVPSEQIGQDASPGHNQADPSQTERTGGQSDDGSHQELSQSGTDNQGAVAPIDPSPTRGPEPIHEVGSNDRSPEGSKNSQENIPDSQIEQAPDIHNADQSQQDGSPGGSSPSLGTDDQSKQDPQQPDQIGGAQPSVDPSQAAGSPEVNSTPSNQIQSNGAPGQGEFSPTQGVGEESKQSPQEPSQAEPGDQGVQGLADPSTAVGSNERMPEGSIDSAQETRADGQREQAPDMSNTSSDQRQLDGSQGQLDDSKQPPEQPGDQVAQVPTDPNTSGSNEQS